LVLETIFAHPEEIGLMTQLRRLGATVVFLASVLAAAQSGLAHGDVTPQAMDTEGLPPLGEKWLTENPYRSNPLAIKIGESGYTQNCARCHGIGAVSGGFAPDLRHLERGADGDEIFIQRIRNGMVRNGAVYMPKFEGILSQEGIWAIRSWLDTKFTE
jgi:cytochrome c-550 PedF